MARFDWKGFLRRYGIEYTTTGPNASRNHIQVKCPFCGPADPSEHMGISLYGDGWSCWRNQDHRGRSRTRLIAALLHCLPEEAARLAGDDAAVDLPDGDIGAQIRSKLLGSAAPKPAALTLPVEFKRIYQGGMAKPFVEYLERRGYKGGQLGQVVRDYELHYATRGKFSYRIILPVRDRRGRLLTWVGRTILQDEELRYLTLSNDYALCNVRDTLLGLERLWTCPNPKVLFVCEGPFDAMWITSYGKSLGVYATCLFGLRMSDDQAILLEDLRARFDQIILLVDNDASLQSFRMANTGMGFNVKRLPLGVKDPAVLVPSAVLDLCFSVF